MPHFRGTNAARAASYRWVGDNNVEFSGKRQAAVEAMFRKHEAEVAHSRGAG